MRFHKFSSYFRYTLMIILSLPFQQFQLPNHRMSSPSFFQSIVSDLIRAKPTPYSEESINFYIDDDKFTVQDLEDVRNRHGQKLKCTLIKHRAVPRNEIDVRPVSNQKHQSAAKVDINQKCIIFLHGLGSSRLQALALVPHLPLNYCLCAFDMSGSGKSQGSYLTYGPKEKQDIEPVLDCLYRRKHIRQFILWGRSMGAVASLLYATGLSKNQQKPKIDRENRLESKELPEPTIIECIKGMVIDSPFHNFKDIAKQIALKRLSIPSFIVDIALSYVEQSFQTLLNSPVTSTNYSPFLINFTTPLNSPIPAIFLYSEHDEVVPYLHSQNIIKNFKSKFQKMVMACSHNQPRSSDIIIGVFQKIEKWKRSECRERRRMDQTDGKSFQRKRGIFVYTPSKQLKRTIDTSPQERAKINIPPFHPMAKPSLIKGVQQLIAMNSNTYENKTHEISKDITADVSISNLQLSKDGFIDAVKTQPTSHRRKLSISKSIRGSNINSTQTIDLTATTTFTRRRGSLRSFDTIDFQTKQPSKGILKIEPRPQGKQRPILNTIDVQTNVLINKKLIDVGKSKEERMSRARRYNLERRNEMRLTHERYLK